MSTSTMKAFVFRQKGKPSQVLRLESDYPKPTPSKDSELEIKVEAISLNPVGWKLMSVAPIKWLQKVPAVPESDLAGVVVGGKVEGSGFEIGSKVFGIKPAEVAARDRKGTLAEFAVVDKQYLRKLPENASFEQAAALPLATHTALTALCDVGGLKKGQHQKVFINGGSGGVGALAIQVAQAYGATVHTTCSPSSRSLVESIISPEYIFDYHSRPLVDQLAEHVRADKKEFDLVFDAIGVPSLYNGSPTFLKKNGLYLDIAGPHLDGSFSSAMASGRILMANMFLPAWLGGTPRTYKFVSMTVKEKNSDEIARMLADGSLRPIIDNVFDFERSLEAYERSMSGRAKGKVVIKVGQED